MSDQQNAYNVLFLCTGDSARSIFAEAILNRFGGARFKAYSAVWSLRGRVNPRAATLLRALNYDLSQLRSKSWEEFSRSGAPELHFVVTVSENAAQEMRPSWPGQPDEAQWSMPDPAEAVGSEAEVGLAFAEAYRTLYYRVTTFVSLPYSALKELALNKSLEKIDDDDAALRVRLEHCPFARALGGVLRTDS